MARPLTLWIVIADGEHARFVQPDADNTLRTFGSLDSASAHLRSRDIGSDRPGRAFESGAVARHAVGPRHDLHAMEQEKFVRLVGEQVNAASGRDEFDELLLVAPPRALNELREALDATTRAKLVGTLKKDLVKNGSRAVAACERMGQPSASPGRLIYINAATRVCGKRWSPGPQTSRLIERRSSMANTPVEVKKNAPAPAAAPDAWRSFRTEMDRLFDRFAGGWGMPSLRRMFEGEPALRYESSFTMPSPAVDISEDEGAYKVTAELPGMTEREIEVVVSGDMLTLKGEKRAEKERREKNYYLSERSYGSFQRSFYVPEGVDRDKIAADFSKGVLTVTMPKTAKAVEQTKKIEVKSAT